jgi:4-amino-4-deoxy-L-arabinose transferase-like glycosyltransferase
MIINQSTTSMTPLKIKLAGLRGNRWLWGLLGLTLIAAWMRFYQINDPAAVLNPDEVSAAYNALLLLETGMDEWQQPWPLVLEAFGDQKIIGYTAATTVFFRLFGYEDWVVRLPSLIAGILLIPLTAMLIRQWTKSDLAGWLSAIIIVLSPVFLFYSRTAYEANVSLMFTILLIRLLTRKATTRIRLSRDLLLIGLIASATVLFYNSPLLYLPLLILLIPAKWRPTKNEVMKGITLIVVWAFWLVILTGLTEQKSQITIFGNATVWENYALFREQLPEWLLPLVGNKYVFYAATTVANGLRFWQPSFLLSNLNGHPWHTLPGTGYLTLPVYLIGLVLLPLVLYVLLAKRVKSAMRSAYWRLTIILMIGLLPASITVNAPHATRSLLTFWAFACLIGVSLAWLVKRFKSIYWLGPILLIMSISMGSYFAHYLTTHADYSRTTFRGALYDDVVLVEQANPGKQVVIIDERGFEYIRAAWYAKLTPSRFFETIEKQPPDTINFKYGSRVGNWRFVRSTKEVAEDEGMVIVKWDGSQWKRL